VRRRFTRGWLVATVRQREVAVSGGEFDILVIGAGIAGSSVAAHLAQDHRVGVLEREDQPGYHSTGRSAALFSEIYGAEPVRALSRASRNFFFTPQQGFTDAPLISPRGSLYLATAEQRESLEKFAALPDVAAQTRRISSAEAHQICPMLRTDRIVTALLEPEAADVDVHALHSGYLRLLRQRGGMVFTNCPVERLWREGELWMVQSGESVWRAPIVVNAAGAWADEIAKEAGLGALGLQPHRRTALLVDPPDNMDIDSWPLTIDFDEQFYFKPTAGLLMLSPADETESEPCDAQPEDWDVAVAVDRVEAATTLSVKRIRRKWAGLRTFAPDRVPVAGYDPDAPGFFWLAGQGGYGIQTCPALSLAAATLIHRRPLPPSLTAAGVNARDLAPERFRTATAAFRERV